MTKHLEQRAIKHYLRNLGVKIRLDRSRIAYAVAHLQNHTAHIRSDMRTTYYKMYV